ncbi:unnamed protein product [Linum trigynum]|uniref:Uncharacterized protein n=1 Tax=Linum trigynum TaxID=586398 RepID=A0AAV2G8X8_9ROSI
MGEEVEDNYGSPTDVLELSSTYLDHGVRKRPSRLSIYECIIAVTNSRAMVAVSDDPLIYEEAVTDRKWNVAMNTKISSIEKDLTQKLTEAPTGVIPIRLKWVPRTKYKEDGTVEKYKTRVVP